MSDDCRTNNKVLPKIDNPKKMIDAFLQATTTRTKNILRQNNSSMKKNYPSQETDYVTNVKKRAKPSKGLHYSK